MNTTRNVEIRMAVVSAGLKYWQVAEAMGISNTHLSRLLRYELTEERKKQILQVVGGMTKGVKS